MTIQREVDLILEQKWEAGTQIRLNNVPMEIEGGIGYQLTNVYPRPERQGEPGPADHPFNATHTQRSWVSGQLHRDLQEAADIAVYWDALAWVQNRGKMGAALKVRKIPLPEDAPHAAQGGMVVPHKRLGQNFIFTAGNTDGCIYEYIAATRSLRNPNNEGVLSFSGTIMNKGVVFQAQDAGESRSERWLYLPSTSGYTRINEDFEVVQAPGFAAIATIGVAIHENKLYRLTENGHVQTIIRHDDGGDDGWDEIALIPDGSDPRNIYETFDDDGNRCIGVSTSTGLFLLDHDNGILWMTDLVYPEHAYQGYGATRWRADDFISVGVGIHRRVGGLVTPEGLDNYDGLPDPLAAGFIVDLAPSYNWLLAAIAGFVPPGEDVPAIPMEELHGVTTNIPYPMTTVATTADFLSINRMGAIFAWNGLGWAKMAQWEHPPTRVEVSMVRNATKGDLQQHLFYGDNAGGCFAIEIPSSYYNPLMSPTLPLERNWYLEEGRLDWDTADTPKIAKQLNVKVDRLYDVMKLPGDADPRPYYNEIRVICHWQDLDGIYHRSDDTNDPIHATGPWPFVDSSGTVMPYITLDAQDVYGNSRQSYSIGWEDYTQESVKLATGLPHLEIWMEYQGRNDLRYELEKDDPTRPPGRVLNELTTGLIEWRSIIGRKWMRPNRVFTFVIDVQTAIKGESEDAIMAFLDECCLKVGGVPLVVNDRFYIVDVTRLDGSNDPGLSPRGIRTITCLEFTDITYEDSIPGFWPR